MVVDDLHCIYLGVTKLLLSLWFGKEFRTKDFSIRRKVNVHATNTKCACIVFSPSKNSRLGERVYMYLGGACGHIKVI